MAVRLYAFRCGGEYLDRAAYDPFDPRVGEKLLWPNFCYLIDHPQGRLLFDTGPHPDLIAEAARRAEAGDPDAALDFKSGDDVVSQLAQLGLDPGDITHIAISHLHYDHAGGLSRFPQAKVYIQEAELPFAHWPPTYARDAYTRTDFDHAVQWRELDGDYDVFGDGTVVLMSTPGHTPGHQSCIVRLESGTVVLAADAALCLENLANRIIPAAAGCWSPEATLRSYRRIAEVCERTGAEVLCTHDHQQRVRLAPDAWYQ